MAPEPSRRVECPDPFAPGAAALPEVAAAGLAGKPRVSSGVLVRVVVGSLVVALVAIVLGGWRVTGHIYSVVAGLLVLVALLRPLGRMVGSSSVVAWAIGVIAVLNALNFAVVNGSLSAPGVVVLLSFGVACAAATVVLGRLSPVARSVPGRPGGERGAVLERHRLAAEWNGLKEALRSPDTRLVRVAAPADDEGPGLWRTSEPRTGRLAVLALDADVAIGSWVVLDDAGAVVAAAPGAALKAWQKVLDGRG